MEHHDTILKIALAVYGFFLLYFFIWIAAWAWRIWYMFQNDGADYFSKEEIYKRICKRKGIEPKAWDEP